MPEIFTFIIAMVVMLILLLGGLWIAVAVAIGGILSLYPMMKGGAVSIFGYMSWENSTDLILVALPLFVFMGEYISSSGLVNRLYSGTSKAISGLPGGLVQTNLIACTIFAACSGSSIACAATMGRVAYPEQVKKRGYDPSLVLGSIAGGGTLGILIPPSIFFVVYGSIADQSVGKLFSGGVVPGLIISSIFMLYVGILVTLRPHSVPKIREKGDYKVRIAGLKEVWPFLLLVASVMGSLYAGVATPTEAAGLGAAVSILIAVILRTFPWKSLLEASMNTMRTNCMIFLILISAKVVAVSLGYYGIPGYMQKLATYLSNPLFVLIFVSVVYLLLGTIFDDFSLMILILPFVLPMVKTVGYDLIWFGVYMCILLQAGMLSPPIGMNLFVMQGVTKAPFAQIVRGGVPFFLILLFGAVIIVIEPKLVLWLANF